MQIIGEKFALLYKARKLHVCRWMRKLIFKSYFIGLAKVNDVKQVRFKGSKSALLSSANCIEDLQQAKNLSMDFCNFKPFYSDCEVIV